MQSLIELYHRRPPTFRDVAASTHGYSVRRWGYGPETDRFAVEAGEREAWCDELIAGANNRRTAV